MDLSKYAPIPWETSLHCNDVSHWLGVYLDWSLLSVLVILINTTFSHSNDECSPYFLVITHQTQAKDGINGLMQERRNSIANALEYFLAPSHPYKENHLWVTTPLPLLFPPSMQRNQYDNALSFFLNFNIGQCTEHIASHYIVPRHIDSTILRLSNLWYITTSTTYTDYWSQADDVQSLNIVPRFMSLILC